MMDKAGERPFLQQPNLFLPGASENWPPFARKPSVTPRFPTVVLILSISPLLPLK